VAQLHLLGPLEAGLPGNPVEAGWPGSPLEAGVPGGPVEAGWPGSPLAQVPEVVVAPPAALVAPPPQPAEVEAISPPPALPDACDRPSAPPLNAAEFSDPDRRRAFRDPLPLTPLWNPPGPRRVGLQAGHWLVEQTPEELSRLQGGASGGGKQEWEVNLDLAQRAARLLEAAGVEVDLLPATVPPRYRAHAFISIHADGDAAGRVRGFKIARPGFSSVPEHDDRLVEALYAAYGPATAIPRDDEHISVRMRYYYAFNSRRYCHAVAPGVPQAIVETGFLTHAADRALLIGDPEAPARGIANGILAFLDDLPPASP
jgi:N-acetylmuramoyl-L-alanine amidase